MISKIKKTLYWACSSTNKSWGLDTLLNGYWQHGIKTYKYKGGLPILLEAASLELYPQDTCLLFQKDQHGKTACEYSFDKYGKDTTIKVLRDLIPPDAPQFPILHHVLMKHVPRYMDDFSSRYPSSLHARDAFDRTLVSQVENHHATLASGSHTRIERMVFYFFALVTKTWGW